MATAFKGVNYTQALSGVKQYESGDVSGKLRVLRENYTLDSAVIDVDDTIEGPLIPENVRVIDAYVHIKSSLGTTGILDLGHKASADGTTHVADPNAFVSGADGGGQAALTRPTGGEAGIGKFFSKAVRSVLTCTEISTNDDVELEFVITYSID